MLTCPDCGGLTPRDTSKTCLHCDAPLRAPRWARTLSRLLGPTGALLLAACYGAPGRYYARDAAIPVDLDRDGSPSRFDCQGYNGCPQVLATELDCDDADATRFPGAADTEGDGIDQNCDGVDGWRDPSNTMATDPDAPATDANPPKAPMPIATPPSP